MTIVEKAVAAVIRSVDGRPELLAFTHPKAGVQIPKGTIEPGESVGAATLRELEEESGLVLSDAMRRIGSWERTPPSRPDEIQHWHVSLLEAPAGLPERWEHSATGSPAEDGLIFAYHWLPVDADLPNRLHPLFGPVCHMLLEALRDAD